MPKAIRDDESPFQRALNIPSQYAKTAGRPTAGKELMWVEPFLDAIEAGYSIQAAAKKAGIAPVNARKRYRTDKVFREAWNDAARIATSHVEHEIQRRAYHGVLKPVFHKGVRVGCVREYSDKLLMFLARARKPRMYDRFECDAKPTTFNVNGDVNIGGVFQDIERDAKLITAPDSDVQPHCDAQPVDAAQPDNTEA